MDPVETKKPKVLFVEDKWCAGKFEWGISEWDSNLLLSLKETGLAETEAFYLDEYYRTTGKKGDEALLQKIKEWKPDLIFLVIYKMPGSAVNVPEWATLRTIKNNLNIPMAAMWGDCYDFGQFKILKELFSYTALDLVGDSETVVRRIVAATNDPEKYAYTWVPKDPKIWKDPKKERDVGISYIGTPKGHRLSRIKYLTKNGVAIVYGGGERQEHLSTEEYADLFQRTKITLSFSRAVNAHVINARVFEAMTCGSMILEQEGYETPKFFIPYVDYVPYFNNRDLVRKAKYYLAHDDEREKIAKNGWEKTMAQYSAKRYWTLVLNKTLGFNKEKMPEFPLTWANLSHMPKWRAAKLKFLNAFCSTTVGFKIFLFISQRANRDWVDYQRNKISKKIHGSR